MTDSKSKILTAASELLLLKGSRALSVRAISKRAGLSTIGIYSHFQGKQGILDALYIQGFEVLDQAMDVLTTENHGKPAVMQAAENYVEFGLRYEAHYRLIFGEADSHHKRSDAAKQASIQAFNRITSVVASLLAANATRDEKQAAAMQIWALAHGFLSLKHHGVINQLDSLVLQSRILEAVENVADALIAKTRNS